ncbi:transposase [Enterococcus faecium]
MNFSHCWFGLDASVQQSAGFTGTKNKLYKRGSPYLRCAI